METVLEVEGHSFFIITDWPDAGNCPLCGKEVAEWKGIYTSDAGYPYCSTEHAATGIKEKLGL